MSASAARRNYGSNTLTNGVRVTATPLFMEQQSDPQAGRFLFAYHITIDNEGSRTVQLLSRHWIIIDADGEREEVRGPGVVGETPIIEPGESHSYSSFCPLTTSWGTMEGSYQMRDDAGQRFDILVGRFVLTMDARRATVGSA